MKPVGHLRAGLVSKKDHSRGDSDMPCSQEKKQKGLSMLTISEGAGHSGNSVPPPPTSSMGLIFGYFHLLALLFNSEPHHADSQDAHAEGVGARMSHRGVAGEGLRAGEGGGQQSLGPTAQEGEGLVWRCQGPRAYPHISKFFLVFPMMCSSLS